MATGLVAVYCVAGIAMEADFVAGAPNAASAASHRVWALAYLAIFAIDVLVAIATLASRRRAALRSPFHRLRKHYGQLAGLRGSYVDRRIVSCCRRPYPETTASIPELQEDAMRAWRMAAVTIVLGGCMTAEEVDATAVDKAEAPIINPDTVHVGAETHALESACSPRLSLCIAEVRGLTWAVRPESVARISGTEPGQVIRVRGVSPGRAWVIAMGRAGGDSSALQVIP